MNIYDIYSIWVKTSSKYHDELESTFDVKDILEVWDIIKHYKEDKEIFSISKREL